MVEVKIEYKYDSEKKILKRVAEHDLIERNPDTQEEIVVAKREMFDVFEGSENVRKQIKRLKTEEERVKQGVNHGKKMLESMEELKKDEELIKLQEQLTKLQKIQKSEQHVKELKGQEEILAKIRDELKKIKLVVPEFDRVK